MASDKVTITTSGVLNMLKEGRTRDEIAEHYNLSKTELKNLFQHPKLKGRKTHKAPSFRLVDDLDDNGNKTAASTARAAASSQPVTESAPSGSTTSSPGQTPAQRDDFFARRNEDVV